jgi:hypothetical protein
MKKIQSSKPHFDQVAKMALAKWPYVSKKLWPPSRDGGAWLRAQPADGVTAGPRLMAAGTNSFKTQPDGLWVFVSAAEQFADCIAIEACSSQQNFADKRSRYQPSTTATILRCPKTWLCGRVPFKSGTRERWRLAHGIPDAPTDELTLPTRFVRVLFFLKDDLYDSWSVVGVPAPHEFVASYSSVQSYTSQAMQRFLRRMSPEQHFYKK